MVKGGGKDGAVVKVGETKGGGVGAMTGGMTGQIARTLMDTR